MHTLNSFLRISEFFSDNYVVKFSEENKDCTVSLYCLDASKFIKNITSENKANVYFSATLTPINYFKDLLGSDLLIKKEKPGLTKTEREEFLNDFTLNNQMTSFCVLGGSFSEGIDLVGKKLIGAAIVGVGMPQISSERNIVKNYFENLYRKGFDYAYTFPGMNKVMQAVGRVIRSEDDKGAVLLIDDRYLTSKYVSLMPYEWSNYKKIRNNEEMISILNMFWLSVK